jgi:hypothetical protein
MTRPDHGEDHQGTTSQPVTTGLADQPEVAGAPLTARSLPWRAGARARRLAWWCVFVLGGVVLFVAYLRVSRTQPVNSDGASNALQAWDLLHGNPLLHGWWLSDVSFYTTELPQYMLVEAVRGLSADVVHVAAAMTYTLLVLLSALLARGPATGRQAALRMALTAGIVLAPQLGTGAYVLLLSPDHVGTSVLVLATWLVLDRAGRRWWVPVIVGALLAWGLVGDPLVLYIGVVPLVLVCGVRAYTELVVRRRPAAQVSFELALAAAAGAAVLVAMTAVALIRAYGGYYAWPARADLITITQVPHNLWLTLDGITVLYGASFVGLHPGLVTALVVLHLAGVVLAGWAVWLGLRRFFRETSLTTAALTAAVVINLVAFLVSTKAVDLKSAREIVAVLPFGAVLAGRLLADRLSAVRPATLLAAVLLGYVLALVLNTMRPPAPAANTRLTTWLAGHHFQYGLGGYWNANSVSLASRGHVQIRALCYKNRRFAAYRWESQASWYDPGRHRADFLVMTTHSASSCFNPSYSQVTATFGKPARAYRVGADTILVWDQNLLAKLGVGHGQVARARPRRGNTVVSGR